MWLEIQLACHPVALSVRIHVLGLAIFVAVGGMSPKSAEWGAGAVSSTFGPFEIVPNPVKFFFAEQVLFASIRETGTYWVRAYNDCFSSSDTVDIHFDDCKTCVHMPDAFTPNGDGMNDVFAPIIGCDFTNYLLKVFNRWGIEVYESSNPIDGWDGKYMGKASEIGTYVYELDYAGTQHSLALDQRVKGYVVLIR